MGNIDDIKDKLNHDGFAIDITGASVPFGQEVSFDMKKFTARKGDSCLPAAVEILLIVATVNPPFRRKRDTCAPVLNKIKRIKGWTGLFEEGSFP